MNEQDQPWPDAPATISDQWRMEQLKRDWQHYRTNPLIRAEIERELGRLLEVLGERGGLIHTYQPPHHPCRQARR